MGLAPLVLIAVPLLLKQHPQLLLLVVHAQSTPMQPMELTRLVDARLARVAASLTLLAALPLLLVCAQPIATPRAEPMTIVHAQILMLASKVRPLQPAQRMYHQALHFK
jgi:hypothetical protein